MSVATNDILKLLSELSTSADQIVEENASEFQLPRLSEWISLVESKANSIVEGENTTESGEIPSVMSYLRGTSQRKGPRVSTVLTEFQRRHLHRRKQSAKTPLRRKSSLKNGPATHTPKLMIPPTIKKVPASSQNSSTSIETPIATTITPVLNQNGGTINMDKRDNRISKRKSSSELSDQFVENLKKPKIDEEREKSVIFLRVEKKDMKAKNSSTNYSNMKSSISATHVGVSQVLKENRALQSKIESKQDKALENRKNIMALRQQKLQENKKAREEKIEKTFQQRLKLEKQKTIKLGKSGGSGKKPTPKAIKKILSGSETKIDKEKDTSLSLSVKNLPLNLKKIGGTTPGALKSIEKTSVNKNQKKHETEKILNSTYVFSADKPSTSNKAKALKDGNVDSNLGAVHMKDSKTLQIHQKDIKAVKAIGEIKSQKQLINSANSSTPIQKKAPDSYAITPARSSFVSYDISEIRSDSEEEEQETNSKPIPSWATGVRLRNALLQQHHHPIDTDELFGNFFDPPNLAVIMGVNKKQYQKRTSSAVWNSSFS